MSDPSPYQAPSAPIEYTRAQAPQLKELKTARWILIILGILYCIVILAQWNNAQKEIDAADERLKAQGSSLEEFLDGNPEAASQVRLGKILVGVGYGVAVVFIVLGVLVYKYPFGAPLAGLILYSIDQLAAIFMGMIPGGFAIVLRIGIILLLIRAVKAGLNWKRSQSMA